MFSSLGWPEFAVLIVVALFVFGPERLPKMAAEAGRMLRTLRQLANSARDELKAELGPELGDLDFDSLNPKTFVRKHLFEDEDLDDFRSMTDFSASDSTDSVGSGSVSAAAAARDAAGEPVRPRSGQRPLERGERAPYDADAT